MDKWSIENGIARRDVDGSMSYCNRVTVYWTWRKAMIDCVSAGREIVGLSIVTLYWAWRRARYGLDEYRNW